MRWAELVLDYVRTLAWPGVTVVALVLFRGPLGDLIDRITEFSAFGAAAKFEDRANRAARAGSSLPDLAGANDVSDATPRRRRKVSVTAPPAEITLVAPQGSVLTDNLGRVVGQWLEVERVARTIGETLDLPFGQRTNVRTVTRTLQKQNKVSQELVSLAEDLQSIRNDLVHGNRAIPLTPIATESLVAAMRNLELGLRNAIDRDQGGNRG